MNRILVSNISKSALSPNDGEKLKVQMQEIVDKKETATIDFDNISRFATPFFNASIAHFVLKLSPKTYEDTFKIDNLNLLGRRTYYHSYDNACKRFYDNIKDDDLNEIGMITKKTIEENC